VATVYKRGKSRYINFVDGTGRRRRRSLGHVDAAAAKATLTEQRLKLIKNQSGATPSPTLEHFSVEYLTWYATQYPSSYDRVMRIFRCHLVPEFGATPLNLITRQATVAFRNKRLATASPETVNKELKTLKAALQRAVEWEVIEANPLDRGGKNHATLYLPKRKDEPVRWYTAAELAQIYEASSPRNAAWWRLLANTGMRRQELLALEWENFHEGRVDIISTEVRPTKGRRMRTVPLNAGAQAARSALVCGKATEEALPTEVALKKATGHVIPQMNLRSLSRCFKLDAERAGLDGTIHSLRHTFCAHLVMAGVALRAVQLLAGHANMKTTERYAHLAPGHLSGAVEAISL
jgi:integrase